MAIEPRDHRIEAIAQMAAEEAYRITIDSLVIDEDTGGIFVKGLGLGGIEQIQPEDTQLSQTWGIRSLPPAYVEGVLTPGNPYATVQSTRDPKVPADLRTGSSKMLRGEAALYDEDGFFLRLMKTAGGILLGKSGSGLTPHEAARKTDKVGSATAFAAWTKSVKDDIAAIKIDLGNLGPPAPTLVPLTTTDFDPAGTQTGTITGGSTQTKIE